MEDITLWQGDCLELMKNIPAGSVDLVLTDPPYGTTQCKWDSVIPFEPMWEQIWRVTKPNAAVCLFGSEPFSSTLRISALKYFKYDWVWEKTQGTGFLNAKIRPLSVHEIISVFGSGRINYYPVKTQGHPRKVSTAIHKRSSAKAEHYGDYGLKDYDSTERYPRSVLTFKSDKQKSSLHPTQKPVALLEYLIKTYTLEGERVLDFTMGSGSTGVARIRTGRKFIGIEKDENYFDIAEKRITEEIYSDLF